MRQSLMLEQLNTVIEYSNTLGAIAKVQGYLHDLEGYALMQLAENGPGMGAIVEIGSFMGRSTCWLALGSKEAKREHVTAIDHFEGSPEHQKGGNFECSHIVEKGSTFSTFKENIESVGVSDYVTPIVASSEVVAEQWNGPIRLLFIDGDHSYEATKKDFDLWESFVIPGGHIAFHDVGQWQGVTRFFQELTNRNSGYQLYFTVAALGVVQKL